MKETDDTKIYTPKHRKKLKNDILSNAETKIYKKQKNG